ncbi:MAG: sulfurtransferase TusA family protein [Candidatus Lokiarchaeota archaeon]|nr:sulfurtransferase TusA family protein [Candidatus Lokiarchaeota archaeon]
MSGDENIKPTKSIDTIGLFCPVPLFQTRENLDSLKVGDVLEVVADDPAAEEDIKRFTKRTGHKLLKFEKYDDYLRFLIEKIK